MRRETTPVILYDGECGLCQGLIRWVLQRDRDGVFRFAALQSAVGSALLAEHGLDPALDDTVVVIDDGQALVRSDASLAIVGRLPGVWRYLRYLRFFPRWLRDRVYDEVALRRDRWPSNGDPCAVPRYRARFLDREPPTGDTAT
jgi:predicted DCC family thiol-disulfide oxidoreductase YuxK